ncbi:UNVERIFIED_CONTAM: putative membrane protein [Acetivibrio alkalicellulosi]
MTKTDISKRVWEIDFARGILIILMTILHTLFNLEYFYSIPINYSSGFVNIIRIMVASSFILVSGISTSFSRSSFKRGMIVLFAALMVTFASYIFNSTGYISFGILHMLSICMISSHLIKRLKTHAIFLLSIILGLSVFILPYIKVTSNYFFMFGLYTNSFISLDYYPLIPWSGLFVFGIGISKVIYKKKISIFKMRLSDNVINFFGRHSLLIYLVHQPVILFLMYVGSKFIL